MMVVFDGRSGANVVLDQIAMACSSGRSTHGGETVYSSMCRVSSSVVGSSHSMHSSRSPHGSGLSAMA